MTALFVVLAMFIVDATIHLISRSHKRGMVGHVTKLFLMPLLYSLIPLFCNAFSLSVDYPIIILLVALCYTLGDICLLSHSSNTLFILGELAFSLGHIFFIVYFFLMGINIPLFIIGLVVGLVIILDFIKRLRGEGSLRDNLKFYLYGVMLVLFVASAFGSYEGHMLPTILSALGALVFIISDASIAFTMTGYKAYSDLFTMSTYIGANTLLVLSVIARSYL